MSTPVLELCGLKVSYGAVAAVREADFAVGEGEITALVGANGAGKTSLLRAISGLAPCRGSILFRGIELRTLAAEQIAALGITHVPEGRGVFANLTVEENLRLAAWGRQTEAACSGRERALQLFPRLYERQAQKAGTLSGGEQQMLAIARALVAHPALLLLDEPSMGLAPVLVREIFRIIAEINNAGTTVLLVEQNANMALRVAHRAYVLENGCIIRRGTGKELLGDPAVKRAYLGE